MRRLNGLAEMQTGCILPCARIWTTAGNVNRGIECFKRLSGDDLRMKNILGCGFIAVVFLAFAVVMAWVVLAVPMI
jgi:hypothetical protein